MALLRCIVCVFTAFILEGSAEQVHNAVETEMFAIPISPNIFNWTYQEFDQQYRFHASLIGKPDLPSWLRYIYSGRHHSGFIFGTPPRGTKSPITIEVVGLNRQDFETRRLLLSLHIKPRKVMAQHEVELKIDNLNVEDLLDDHRMTRLKDIFRTKLWPESKDDLYATFLASAIDLGARLPLKPNDGEGLVVRLGSSAVLSQEVKDLREEVRPLSRLTSCPREYKRTSVEILFRDAGLTLDWCSFQLYNTVYKERTTELVEYLSKIPNKSSEYITHSHLEGLKDHIWSSPRRFDLPTRDMTMDITWVSTISLIVMSIMLVTIAILRCYYHIRIKQARAVTAQLSAMSAEYVLEYAELMQQLQQTMPETYQNIIDHSASQNKSTTNLAGNYNRPQPPPYMGANTTALYQKLTHTDPNKKHSALEQSLKLLNEAKISNEYVETRNQIVDFNDGSDDYVPIASAVPDVLNDDIGNADEFLVSENVDVGTIPVKTWFC